MELVWQALNAPECGLEDSVNTQSGASGPPAWAPPLQTPVASEVLQGTLRHSLPLPSLCPAPSPSPGLMVSPATTEMVRKPQHHPLPGMLMVPDSETNLPVGVEDRAKERQRGLRGQNLRNGSKKQSEVQARHRRCSLQCR